MRFSRLLLLAVFLLPFTDVRCTFGTRAAAAETSARAETVDGAAAKDAVPS